MYHYRINLFLFVALNIVTNISEASGLELKQGSIQQGVQINRPAALIRQAPQAPLPNSQYKLPPTNRNFQPQLTIPARPNIQPNYGTSSSHRAWCQNRYGNYRLMDNSYKDHAGMRQNCVSPYGR